MSTCLEWKPEPLSPQLFAEESWVSDDAALYWSTLDESTDLETDLESLESKAEVASKLLDGLDSLDNLDELIKEEPFPDLLEDKIRIFEDIQPVYTISQIKPEDTHSSAAPDTQSLLQEFETIFDAVEMTHGTLTPPQSPPYKPFLITLEPLKCQLEKPQGSDVRYLHPLPTTNPTALAYHPSPTPQPDVDQELAVVDELVRTRAQDMVQSPSSPDSSSSSTNGCEDYSSDDPEWIPNLTQQVVPTMNVKSRGSRKLKPYSRVAPEDKKSRKKEQNKNAATRYRMKKKAEMEEIQNEERSMREEKQALENRIHDLGQEIRCLKKLMRELFQAKGLID